jgi:flavin-dependent dehydrogenase
MRKVDLLVAGAGPAGCAAALSARRAAAGLSVLVVDAARFPRDKPCGGAITGGGLGEMEHAGLALRVEHAIATHAVLRVDGRSARVALPRPAAVVRRSAWDADLVAQIRAAGVEVAEGAPLLALATGEAAHGSSGVADTGTGPVAFRALVCADGAGGPSRRLLGLPVGQRAPLREAIADRRGQKDLVFDLDAGLAGYAWRFPCVEAGRAAESAGAYSIEGDPRLDPALGRWMAAEGLALAPAAAVQSWSLRLFDPSGPVGLGPALLAGDALGADPLAGEGIRYALWSGRVAGRLAARALALPPAVAGRWLAAAYRARLAATRSGATLRLLCLLAPRLHGGETRWRRVASDRAVAEALAALVSGLAPAGPLLRLLGRYRALRRAPP